MPVHTRLLTLVAVFAVANIGVATYLAASPRAPAARVTIAAASDDPLPPSPQQPTQPTSVPATPTPAPVPQVPRVAPCGAALDVTPVDPEGPREILAPGANVRLAQFHMAFSMPTSCAASEPASITSMTFAFTWSNLDPQVQRRAALRNIRIADARGVVRGALRIHSSTAREATIAFRRPLAIAAGNTEALTVTADLRSVPIARSARPAGLVTRIVRMSANLPYAYRIGNVDVSYPAEAHLTVERDPASPSGTQIAGVGKELARFRVLVRSTEPLEVTRYDVHFDAGTNGSVAPFIPTDLRYILTRMNGAPVTRLEHGQWYALRVTGDTTGAPIGGTLRLVLDDIAARGVTTGTVFDRGLMDDPLPANVLAY